MTRDKKNSKEVTKKYMLKKNAIEILSGKDSVNLVPLVVLAKSDTSLKVSHYISLQCNSFHYKIG